MYMLTAISTLLAQNPGTGVDKIFGNFDGPAGQDVINRAPIGEAVARMISFLINMSFTVVAILVLLYMLWGAYLWISSGGEAEKISAARKKMVQAVIGMIVFVAVFSIWATVISKSFGLIKFENGGIEFKLPTINNFNDGGAANPDPIPRSPGGTDKAPKPF